MDTKLYTLLLSIFVVLVIGCANEPEPPETPEEGPKKTGTMSTQAPAEAEDDLVDTNVHRWGARLKKGDGIALVNEHGDLRARQGSDGGINYAAVVQKLDGEAREVDIGTHREPEALRIEITVPEEWNGRVDAAARVPTGSALNLRTANGLIEVRTGDNDVVASSPGGPIKIRTHGRIEARGETGDMLISMFGTEFGDDGAGVIETVSGNIEFWLQTGANVTLYASAGGGIDMDIGDAGAVVESGDKTAEVRFGEGKARLDVRSDQGVLVLRMLPDVR